ncbi:MAG: hypothetical protein ACHP8A_16190 [Terriglobales bacterium]
MAELITAPGTGSTNAHFWLIRKGLYFIAARVILGDGPYPGRIPGWALNKGSVPFILLDTNRFKE